MSGKAYRKLTPQKRHFVDLIVRRTIPTDAMRLVRPHLERPEVLASKWKALPEVRAAIEEREAEAMEEAGITNAQILLGIARIATLSVKDLVHKDGRPKAVHELDDDVARAIQSIEIEHIVGSSEKGGAVLRTKLRAPSKNEAFKMLGLHQRLFAERHEHSGPNGSPIPIARVERVIVHAKPSDSNSSSI